MWGEFLKNLLTKILIAACVIGIALALSAAAPLFAQDTPVGLPGTEVATQDTPAAAANSEELRKQSQNPVASLISVPIQRLPTDSCAASHASRANHRRLWLGRYEPYVFPGAEKKQGHLGHRAYFRIAYCDQHHLSRSRKTQHGAVRCRTGTARALDGRGPREQCPVCGWPCQFQYRQHSE